MAESNGSLYRRVDDLRSPAACTPGSVLGPTLGVEYAKPLNLPFLLTSGTDDGIDIVDVSSVGKLDTG